MNTLKFKSNIQCDNCIAKVTEALDATVGKHNWEVDIKNPDKILTIKAENVTEKQVEDALEKVGYKASIIAG